MVEGGAGGVDRHAELTVEDAGGTDVIGVVVGDDEAVYISNVCLMGAESRFGLFAADAGVEQEPDAVGFNVDAVAVGAGLKRDQLH